MSAFRRFIIGFSTFLLVIWLIPNAIIGAVVGLTVARLYPSVILQGMHIGDWLATDVLGFVLGGAIGLIIPALPLAFLFLLEEIHKDAKRTADYLGTAAGDGYRAEPKSY